MSVAVADTNEVARFWPAILACFATAVFGWGFGFSGPSVYLAELHRLRGWPNGLISSAITAYYLAGAFCLGWIHVALRRLGPGLLLAAGVIVLGIGATAFCRSTAPWQLFCAACVMAVGWAGCTSTAISTSLAVYFRQRRGLAITLALNGASTAGFTIGPLLVVLSQQIGLRVAVPSVAIGGLLIVLPLIWFGFRASGDDVEEVRAAPAPASTLLRRWDFWSVALPFALALAAQVGVIVHLVSFLLPTLGPAGSATGLALTSVAAVTGRLGLAAVIDRLPQRPAACASFASQAVGLLLMLTMSHVPAALYAGCLLFGLSVGNVITYPALMIQREFPAAEFAAVIGLSTAIGQFTYSLAPALLGVIRDAAGSYGPVLMVCMALQACGAVLVMSLRRRSG
jgi:predicted MFS family arabinose efflux permease